MSLSDRERVRAFCRCSVETVNVAKPGV